MLISKFVVAHTTTMLSLGHHIPTKRPSNSLRDRTDSGAVKSFEERFSDLSLTSTTPSPTAVDSIRDNDTGSR